LISAITSVAHAQTPQPTLATPRCTLTASEMPTPPLSPALLALAPQYFHPTHHGMFLDLIPGTSRYAYYDPGDPTVRAMPPPGIDRVEAVTQHFVVGATPGAASLAVAPRGAPGGLRTLRGSSRLRVEAAVENDAGSLFVLARRIDAQGRGAELLALYGDDSRPPVALSSPGTGIPWNAAASLSAGGDVVFAWVEPGPAEGRLALRVAWLFASNGTVQPSREVDVVTLPRAVAALSVITTFNVSVTRDIDGAVVAWRPLATPRGPVDTGTESRPPSTSFAGEVRIVRVAPNRAQLASTIATTVTPLGGVTGIGPWPLDPGGMWAFALNSRAVVAWIESTSLVAAFPGDRAPTTIVRDAMDTLLVTRASASQVEAMLYQSAPRFRRFVVDCVRP
jgi:hypothetical protein